MVRVFFAVWKKIAHMMMIPFYHVGQTADVIVLEARGSRVRD